MKQSSSFKKYVSVSLAVHVLVLVGLHLFENKGLEDFKSKSVSIELLSTADIPQLSANDLKKIKKLNPSIQNQIVEQSEKSINEKDPTDARFLSSKNQTVTKQTIAGQKGQFQNLQKMSSAAKQPGDGKEKSEKQQAKHSKENSEEISKNLFSGYDPDEGLKRTQTQKISSTNDKPEGKGVGSSTDEAPKDLAEASRTNDYVKDVDNGLETMLNTREFKYYSYYNRIRRQLTQHWEGQVRRKLSKMFREGRSPASSGQDRITKLMIHLDNQGSLVRVQVLMDSGVRDLDDAAIDAFRAAAPFPNPPKGIIENDGTVKIRWDFVLES